MLAGFGEGVSMTVVHVELMYGAGQKSFHKAQPTSLVDGDNLLSPLCSPSSLNWRVMGDRRVGVHFQPLFCLLISVSQ